MVMSSVQSIEMTRSLIEEIMILWPIPPIPWD